MTINCSERAGTFGMLAVKIVLYKRRDKVCSIQVSCVHFQIQSTYVDTMSRAECEAAALDLRGKSHVLGWR